MDGVESTSQTSTSRDLKRPRNDDEAGVIDEPPLKTRLASPAVVRVPDFVQGVAAPNLPRQKLGADAVVPCLHNRSHVWAESEEQHSKG